MLEYKASAIARVPVALTVTATGLPHAGVLAAAVTVTVVKSNGVIATYTPSGGQWTEFTWDAYAGSGYYNLSIPVGDTDVVGILNYCVSVAGDDLYFGVVNIVANLEADTYGRVGSPVGASISADIAAVKAQTQSIDAKTTNLPADPADASDVSGAITAAVTSIKGADARDNTQVYDSVAVVRANVTEIVGLLHKNAVLEGQVYNAGGRLTNATLYVYDTNTNAAINDHITGLIHSYAIFATYDVNDHQTYYSLQSLS